MGTKTTQVIGGATNPDERIRIEWGQNLAEQMALRELTPKGLAQKIRDEFDETVSRQAVDAWIAGEYAPRPYMQGVLGALFAIPPRVLFPLPAVPKKAA